MKKMCKLHGTKLCFQEDYKQWDKTYKDTFCPKNTNSKCEIITPKKRDKVVKAWAWIRNGKVWDACVRKWSIDHKLIPCAIHIKASDWEKL